MPFKQEARAAELARLARELEAGQVSGDQALNRLWSAIEDELRLTRENGLYQQRVELEGLSVGDVRRIMRDNFEVLVA